MTSTHICLTGQRSNFLVRICGNVESAKEFVVSPDDVEEDSDSDKEPDQDIEVINVPFYHFIAFKSILSFYLNE